MQVKKIFLFSALISAILLFGCSMQQNLSKEKIPFKDNQYYAAAYLGYDNFEKKQYYLEKYTNEASAAIHYISQGDCYLIIPRYPETDLSIYRIDMESGNRTLLFEQADSSPFVIKCNESDIFSDVLIRFTYQNKVMEFSPFISLKDGSLDIGENGLDITENF